MQRGGEGGCFLYFPIHSWKENSIIMRFAFMCVCVGKPYLIFNRLTEFYEIVMNFMILETIPRPYVLISCN
jgi:hypothetical protein